MKNPNLNVTSQGNSGAENSQENNNAWEVESTSVHEEYCEIDERGRGIFINSFDMSYLHRKNFSIPDVSKWKVDNSSVESRLQSLENLSSNSRPMTSFLHMDDGSIIFTHAGYFGKMTTGEDGGFLIEHIQDVSDREDDFNPYQGIVIGEKVDRLTPISAVIYDYRTSKADTSDDIVFDKLKRRMDGALIEYFEQNPAKEPSRDDLRSSTEPTRANNQNSYDKEVPLPKTSVDEVVDEGSADRADVGDTVADSDKKGDIKEGEELGREFNSDRFEELKITTKNFEDLDIDIEAQSDLVKGWIEEYKDVCFGMTSAEIDGVEFNFIPCNSYEEIAALVKDRDGKYKLRAFRFSGSDHQYKSVCAMRPGAFQYCKGDEKHENHHYVQSAKLDPRIIKVIEESSYAWDAWDAKYGEGSYKEIIEGVRKGDASKDTPERVKFTKMSWESFNRAVGMNEDFPNGEGLDNYEFSEERVSFRNDSWNKAINLSNLQYRIFDNFFFRAERVDNDYTKTLFEGFLSSAIPTDSNNFAAKMNEFYPEFLGNTDKWQKDIFPKIMERNIPFRVMEKAGMVPDFTQEPITKFSKQTDSKEIGDILVETYIAKNEDGDTICWDMATDQKGRVYIDNIYDGKAKVDSYGTFDKKINAGWLVYKPEDYEDQADNIPVQFKSSIDGSGYVDISKFLELFPPIAKYKQALAEKNK